MKYINWMNKLKKVNKVISAEWNVSNIVSQKILFLTLTRKDAFYTVFLSTFLLFEQLKGWKK